jgi:hypothetical protein
MPGALVKTKNLSDKKFLGHFESTDLSFIIG